MFTVHLFHSIRLSSSDRRRYQSLTLEQSFLVKHGGRHERSVSFSREVGGAGEAAIIIPLMEEETEAREFKDLPVGGVAKPGRELRLSGPSRWPLLGYGASSLRDLVQSHQHQGTAAPSSIPTFAGALHSLLDSDLPPPSPAKMPWQHGPRGSPATDRVGGAVPPRPCPVCVRPPGSLVKMQLLPQQVWGGAWHSAYLPG